MQIRSKLTLQFTFIVALIVLLSFVITYAMLSRNRKNEFYVRLENRALTNAELLLNGNSIDSSTLRIIDNSDKDLLTYETLRIFSYDGKQIYANNDSITFKVAPTLIHDILLKGRVRFKLGGLEYLGIRYEGKFKSVIITIGAYDTATLTKNAYLFNLLSLLYCFIIIIIMISGWVFAQKALSPLTKVISQVNNLPVESLETRLNNANSKDEIGQLISTFNRLLDKIQSVFKLQKLLLTAVSHEMKNPMTSITSQLQVLQLNTRSIEEYQKTIASVLEDITRLNKTSHDFLEFTRLSYEMNAGVNFTPVRVDDIIWQSKEYFTKVNPSSQVEIIFENPPKNENALIVLGSEPLLLVAFLNLIDNGCKFSNNQSVIINLKVYEKEIEVKFLDNGIGMTDDEQEHIFEPFYRANNTSGIVGHGLGLAIVNKIIKIHNGSINLISESNVGTSFFIKLPRAF